MKRWKTVFIALGSNRGIRQRAIKEALALIKRHPQLRPVCVSSLYLTSPVGPRQKDFYNAAAKCRTLLSPLELLKELKNMEAALGRKPSALRWSPRVIDLDILLFGKRVIRSARLSIPHHALHKRRFVLEPLAEIAPRVVHPVLKKTIGKLRREALLTCPDQKVKMMGRAPVV